MTPTTPRPGSHGWQTAIRLAGRLIADGGCSHVDNVRDLSERSGHAATGAVRNAVRALTTLGLARRNGHVLVYADDLAALAAWVASELEAHPWRAY